MNKKIAVICAVAGLAFASSAFAANVVNTGTTSVDVYGYAKGAHVFNQKSVKNGFDKSEGQIGVKAKQQLNKNFALLGQYEGEYDNYDSGVRHWHNRLSFSGIDAGKAGAVTVGRQQGIMYSQVGSLTDVNPEVISGWSSAPDTGFLGRTDSVIQYQNSLAGVTVTGQYKLATTKSLETGKANNEGAGYGVAVSATNIADTGLFGSVAYANQHTVAPKGSDTYGVAGGWTNGAAYVAASSITGTNVAGVKKFRDNEVIGTYTFDNGLTPALGYVDSNAFGTQAKYVETGIGYAFNKNVIADVGYGIDVTGRDDNQVKTGLKYRW